MKGSSILKRPSKWFAFPTQPQAVRALAEAHAGKSVMGLSTPLPEEPRISLVQVLTFVDPLLGYRHVFPDETCQAFLDLALSVHAGLRVNEQVELATLVKAAEPVASVFGAGPEELFVLVPTRVAPLVQGEIERLLGAPEAITDPWAFPARPPEVRPL